MRVVFWRVKMKQLRKKYSTFVVNAEKHSKNEWTNSEWPLDIEYVRVLARAKILTDYCRDA